MVNTTVEKDEKISRNASTHHQPEANIPQIVIPADEAQSDSDGQNRNDKGKRRYNEENPPHNKLLDIGSTRKNVPIMRSITDPPPTRSTLSLPTGSTDAIPIYKGSYTRSSNISLKSYGQMMSMTPPPAGGPTLSGVATPRSEHGPVGPRMSYLQYKLAKLFANQNTEQRATYGIQELRDGFFDAIVLPPTAVELDTIEAVEQGTLLLTESSVDNNLSSGSLTGSSSLNNNNERKRNNSSTTNVFLSIGIKLWFDFIEALHTILSKEQGMRLVKAFIAYFITYILCLVVPTGHWFGRYNFFAPLSSIIHHSGRTCGSQIEISIESIIGLALGLGWGSLGIYVSVSTGGARDVYGLINALSVILCLLISAWLKAAFIRMHHGLTSLVLAVFFLGVVGVNNDAVVDWRKTWDFGIPYLFGILIALVVNLIVFPNFGHNSIIQMLQSSLEVCQEATALFFSNEDKSIIERKLSMTSLELSEAVREFCNEISISTIHRKDIIELRNSIQIAIGQIRAVPAPSSLYMSSMSNFFNNDEINATTIPVDPSPSSGVPSAESIERDAAAILRQSLSKSSKNLVISISQTIQACCDYLRFLHKAERNTLSSKIYDQKLIQEQLHKLEEAIGTVSNGYAQTLRMNSSILTHAQNQEFFDILLHIYHLAEAGKSVLTVTKEFHRLSIDRRRWKISLPSYPFRRALLRTTQQIRHDRGGQTASYYYRAKQEVDEIFDQIRVIDTSRKSSKLSQLQSQKLNQKRNPKHGIRYKTWSVLHRLQGLETRFALKTALAVSLISLPGWLIKSNFWFNQYDCWIAGLIVYILIHPRVGGNAHDFLVRSGLCLAGSIWAGIGFRARYGNPYVLAVFCAIFMIPCLYRLICTHHPRSGIIGCISFTFVSLTLYEAQMFGDFSGDLFNETWTRVVACEVGVLVVVLVNWILWPFIGRHEVRKSMSKLLLHIGQSYQLVTDRYLYRDKDDEPTELTMQLSEIRENRILRSMFALGELLQTTHHEPSLRGSFDEAPYAAMLHSCELIFRNILSARINSMHFNIYDFDHDGSSAITEVKLMALRRDAVASVLFVLYILSGAFRKKYAVPKYLPSSAMARKSLFEYVAEAEAEIRNNKNEDQAQSSGIQTRGNASAINITGSSSNSDEKRMWALVHETAFSKSFTRTTEELEKLIGYSKSILGEQTL